MAKYAQIKDGKIINVIEVEPDNITTTYIENDRGDKLPTFEANGRTIISTTKYLVPEGIELIPYEGGNIGDDWPLI